MDKLQNMLPPNVLVEVVSCLSPGHYTGDDGLSWSKTSNGDFTTKSVYDLVKGVEHQRSDSVWEAIWDWNGHDRVKHFLWKIAKGGLLTNSYHWNHHMGTSYMCPVCGVEEETSLHILHDCTHVRCAWVQIIDSNVWNLFFRSF